MAKQEAKSRVVINKAVSCGTLRHEDLIQAFSQELKRIDTDRYNKHIEDLCEDLLRAVRNLSAQEYDEIVSEIAEELMVLLGEYAPEGAYFGSHPGDGADFGFWPIEE